MERLRHPCCGIISRQKVEHRAPLTHDNAPYTGRFAPSPTGPLHFGSLVAATASYLEARVRQGRWLLRMEDVDRFREIPGAADAILRALEALGFRWDGAVLHQRPRDARYAAALARLQAQGWAYPCGCSRKEIAQAGLRAADGGWRYSGVCRAGVRAGRQARLWRLRVDDAPVCIDDGVQGRFCQRLEREVGDFVLRRADGVFAYQLAVVVDDAEQGVSHVVRGSDLLASTPRQCVLQRALGLPTPEYLHVPVATDAHGAKWSKQTHAPAIEAAPRSLLAALRFLGQTPERGLARADCATIWQWAIEHWDARRIPRRLGVAWDAPAANAPPPDAPYWADVRESASPGPSGPGDAGSRGDTPTAPAGRPPAYPGDA